MRQKTTAGRIVPLSLLACAAAAAMASAQPRDTNCKPRNVVVWEVQPRVHVQCVAAVGGIKYFAYRSSDRDAVARVLTILTAARAAGADLVINYDPADTSGGAWGCNPSDCRPIRAVGF